MAHGGVIKLITKKNTTDLKEICNLATEKDFQVCAIRCETEKLIVMKVYRT